MLITPGSLKLTAAATPRPAAGLQASTASAAAEPLDSFDAREPVVPVWKKAVNGGMLAVAGSVAGVAASTVVVANLVTGSDALGGLAMATLIGAPVGLALGAVVGWKNVSAQDAGVGRKLLNAAGWGVAGAGLAAAGLVGVVASAASGPDSLGALLLAPAGATVGGVAGAAMGWKMLSRKTTA